MDVLTSMCICSRVSVPQSLQDPCQSHLGCHSTTTAPVKPDGDHQDPKSNGHLSVLFLTQSLSRFSPGDHILSGTLL